MGTLGRDSEIAIFIDSLLSQQGDHSWQLIIVDQNEDDRVKHVVSKYINKIPTSCSLLHIKTSIKGLSRARNIGLKACQSSIIGFPDDDCVYADNVLSLVESCFLSESSNKLVVTLDDTDKLDCLNIKKPMVVESRDLFNISSYNIFRDAISYTIFVSGMAKEQLFDERFGVGCYFGAAEETDYIYRLKMNGWQLLKVKEKLIFHPQKDLSHSNYDRAYSYNLGIGAFFRKNINFCDTGLTMFFVFSTLKLIVRVLLNVIIYNPKELKWFWSILSGRVKGVFMFDNVSERGGE